MELTEPKHQGLALSTAFMESGACKDMDPGIFYPEKGESTKNAKQICHVCPVKNQCLEYALANNERYGIWGGVSERRRREIQKMRKQPPQASVPQRKAQRPGVRQRGRSLKEACVHGHSRSEHWRVDRSGRAYCGECQRLNAQRQRERTRTFSSAS